jgi:hypothetical protein
VPRRKTDYLARLEGPGGYRLTAQCTADLSCFSPSGGNSLKGSVLIGAHPHCGQGCYNHILLTDVLAADLLEALWRNFCHPCARSASVSLKSIFDLANSGKIHVGTEGSKPPGNQLNNLGRDGVPAVSSRTRHVGPIQGKRIGTERRQMHVPLAAPLSHSGSNGRCGGQMLLTTSCHGHVCQRASGSLEGLCR